MTRRMIAALMLSALFLTVSFATYSAPPAKTHDSDDDLTGSWRSRVQFKAGAFEQVKDLEFMYAFNAGGTMTESSNYDGAPPVPPAYGVWRKVSPRHYEAKYVFFISKAPKTFADIAGGGGWLPGGSGVLVETITLAEDGKSFRSSIKLDVFDEAGKLVESNSAAEGTAVRLTF